MLVHSRTGMPELKVKGFGFVELLLLLLLLLHLVWSFGEFVLFEGLGAFLCLGFVMFVFVILESKRLPKFKKIIIIIIETVVAFVYPEDPRGFSPEGEATCPTGS